MSSNTLRGGSEFHQGQFLMADNAEWKAVFQGDANFVVYGWKPVWASDTWGVDATRLCMQGDCNLVMYNDADKPRWHTNTALGSCNTCELSLTNEGKLVIKRDGREIWNSSQNHGMK